MIQENSEDNYVFSSAEKRALNYPASSGFSRPDATEEKRFLSGSVRPGETTARRVALNTHSHWTVLLR